MIQLVIGHQGQEELLDFILMSFWSRFRDDIADICQSKPRTETLNEHQYAFVELGLP